MKKQIKKFQNLLIRETTTVEEAMKAISLGQAGIAIVIDSDDHFLATITDGDIRRAILRKVQIDTPVSNLIIGRTIKHSPTVVAPMGTSDQELLKLMKSKDIQHIPLLDKENRVKDLAWIQELLDEKDLPSLTAVVMAGGKGERLRPFTEEVPKPMLPIDNKPILEHMIGQLKKHGISNVFISAHYKSEIISDHFGDGKEFGVDIKYIHEAKPLGTAGSLGALARPDKQVLIVNGDILTGIDFRAFFEFHRIHKAVMTVGVRKYEIKIPFGVVELEDILITDIIEKPDRSVVINAGIYLLEPEAFEYLKTGEYFEMPELVQSLIKAKKKVISFPVQEYWLDVGKPSDYHRANNDVKNGKV